MQSKSNNSDINICVFCIKMKRLKMYKHNFKLCKSDECQCFCSEKKQSLDSQITQLKALTEYETGKIEGYYKCWMNRRAPFNGADMFDD